MKPLEKTYTDWTVIGTIVRRRKPCGYAWNYFVKCRCKCGTEKMVQVGDLRKDKSKRCESCGIKSGLCSPRPKVRDRLLTAINETVVVGKEYEFWTVIEPAERRARGEKQGGYFLAKCRCRCGTERRVRTKALLDGDSKSCGCRKVVGQRICTQKRNKEDKRLQHIWGHMIRRCTNKKDVNYFRYGGRGITVCQEWLDSFDAFLKWAKENGAEKGLHIDRKDNNKGYSPDNCHFVTCKTNARNTRRNINVTAFGETKCLSAWAEDHRCVVKANGLYHRIVHYKLPPELAITMKSNPGVPLEITYAAYVEIQRTLNNNVTSM